MRADKITDILARADRPLISYELTPPARHESFDQLRPTIETLVSYDPPFIDVTSRASELVTREADGKLEQFSIRKRVGTDAICMLTQERYGVAGVPHLLCKGFTKEETEDVLVGLHYAGIRNILALRGDDLNYEKPVPKDRSVNEYAIDLVKQIKNFNSGQGIRYPIECNADFCIGVAGYPEKHMSAGNMKLDIQRLKEKIDAGADYIVTQMFFDNQKFYDFVERCRSAGIQVPIIPGLKIFTRRKQLELLPKMFRMDFPEEFTDRLEALPKDQKGVVGRLGVDWAVKQVEEMFSRPDLYKGGKLIAHFYVLGGAGPIKKVMDRLGELKPYKKTPLGAQQELFDTSLPRTGDQT